MKIDGTTSSKTDRETVGKMAAAVFHVKLPFGETSGALDEATWRAGMAVTCHLADRATWAATREATRIAILDALGTIL